MIKRIIRVVTSSATAAIILGGMTFLGFKLGILRNMVQGGVCLTLGLILITVLSMQIIMERNQISMNK